MTTIKPSTAAHTYGTIDSATTTNMSPQHDMHENGGVSATPNGDEESAGLLGGGGSNELKTEGLVPRLSQHFNAEVSIKWGDAILLLCYVITGLLDSSSVFIWGSFVSMQTGNTIYLGLGLVRPDHSTRWIRSIISISSFCAGSFLFARFHRHFALRRRWVLIASFGAQTLLIVAAAIIVSLGADKQSTEGPITVWIGVPLALVALQAGGQTVASRVLQFGSLTSVVLTSIYCDLFSDQRLFAPLAENVERNRRAVAPVCLLLGAVLGGLWAEHEVGLPGALWAAAVLKGVIVVAWVFWRREKGEEDS